MKGRKPKPTWLKVISGNPGKRPINAQEPLAKGDLTEPPEWMTESQREVWRAAIANAPAGLLKGIDESVFSVWVVAKDLHREASQKIAEYGAVIKSPVTETPMQSPYVGVLNRQAQIMLKASSEMGFTPSARSRVRIENEPTKVNKFADLKTLDG